MCCDFKCANYADRHLFAYLGLAGIDEIYIHRNDNTYEYILKVLACKLNGSKLGFIILCDCIYSVLGFFTKYTHHIASINSLL